MNPSENLSGRSASLDIPSAASSAALRFESGEGNRARATHASIETTLEFAGFRKDQIRAIYYGNWLRDYSQLLDPKLVRASSMPKNFPQVLSREALTKVVDVLAVREFPDLMVADRSRFLVTPERLGVYRPAEHIDNPKAVNPSPANPKERDEDFEDWILPGDPRLEVDPDTSMKRYLKRSVDVMNAEFSKAMEAGPESTDGLRALGAALHILEDFFAHSNFVELSLIKLGHTQVLPWTSEAPCKHRLPLVTGLFGGSDIIASLAAPLGKILFSKDEKPFEATQAGTRYERDKVLLILLGEHPDPRFLQGYEAFLAARDKWASLPFSEQVEKFYYFLGTPGKILSSAVGTVMQGLTTWFGNSVDDFQTSLGDDPNTSGSTDPSHSQLAKDHAEHPLHLLTAALARKAVQEVGQAVLARWRDKQGAEHPAHIAARYFAHPMDSAWQDDLVRAWATNNPGLVQRATLKTDLIDGQTRLRNNAQEALQRFRNEGAGFLDTFNRGSSLSDLWSRITGK
jgi:hypothetical protein